MVTLPMSPLSSQFAGGQRSLRPLLIAATFVFVCLLFFTGSYVRSSSVSTSLLKADNSTESETTAASSQLTLFDDVYNSTLGFEKVFSITMPYRTDQRDATTLASSVTGFDVEFIDGVSIDSIKNKVLPGQFAPSLQGTGSLAAWRAHINLLQEIVHRGISSALIMEGDVDWDLRLKDQLRDLAVSSHAAQQVEGPTYLDFHNLPPPSIPSTSPYGDNWDLLWLGHCATTINDANPYVYHTDDPTVAHPAAIFSLGGAERDALSSRFPIHTRVVTKGVQEGCCSLAYAVTQAAARRILYDIGMTRLTAPYDVSMANWCEGKDIVSEEERPFHRCIGVMPQLFDTHLRAGALAGDSDINTDLDENTERRETGFTFTIRWSTRLNLRRLLSGWTSGFEDGHPDPVEEEQVAADSEEQ